MSHGKPLKHPVWRPSPRPPPTEPGVVAPLRTQNAKETKTQRKPHNGEGGVAVPASVTTHTATSGGGGRSRSSRHWEEPCLDIFRWAGLSEAGDERGRREVSLQRRRVDTTTTTATTATTATIATTTTTTATTTITPGRRSPGDGQEDLAACLRHPRQCEQQQQPEHPERGVGEPPGRWLGSVLRYRYGTPG